MARKRATMREGPLAELFRKTEAAQRAQDEPGRSRGQPEPRRIRAREAALEETVEHVHDFASEPEPHGGLRARAARRGRAGRQRSTRSRRGRRVAGSRPLLPDDARARAAASSRAAAEGRRVHRRHPRRRRRRSGAERDPPHDGRGDRAGRLRRRQHRPAGARDLGRADEDRNRRGTDARVSAPAPIRGSGARPPRRRPTS